MLKILYVGMIFFFLVHSQDVTAEVVINGTRIVFNAEDKESTIQLKNQGNTPYLLQLWIDDGNLNAKPSEINVPFLITPPVIRIDPSKGQAVRIIMTRSSLPQDRESLFWFNMLEIPPRSQDSMSEKMQLAFRTRIKLFYRPHNLHPTSLQSYKELKILQQKNKIKIINNSPYHITFRKIEIHREAKVVALAILGDFRQRIVKPKSEAVFTLSKKESLHLVDASVFYTIVNDYGGETTYEQELQSSL